MKKRLMVASLFIAVMSLLLFAVPAAAQECPCACCIEYVNPHGQNIPPAGSSTLPGPKGGINDDGFYKITAFCPLSHIFISYVGSTTPLLFDAGIGSVVIKFTEAPGAAPQMKKIGSTNGQAGAVDWHIILPADPTITIVSTTGESFGPYPLCPVPPPPK